MINASASESALGKEKLLTSSDVKKSLLIPDSLRDENSLDIQRVQIYFETTAWKTVKRVIDEKKNANGYLSFATNSLRMERALGVIAACCGVICLVLTCRRNQRQSIGFAMLAGWIILKNWWVRSLIVNYVLFKGLFLLYNPTLKVIHDFWKLL